VSAAGKLVLWYDNDPAGEKGYTRLVETLLPVLGRSGVRERVRRVRINAPDAKDANDLHHLGRLRPLMESAPWMT
jgi:DNA primase